MTWNLIKQPLLDQDKNPTSDYVALLALDRPKAANSLSALMVAEGTKLVEDKIQNDPQCRLVILYGLGKHFCAGADLKWMQDSATKSYDENISDATRLQKLFESIKNIKAPTLAVVRGAAYGGGVGLIAACDMAICQSDAKICLSEVNIGIIPSVILPYLGLKMNTGSLNLYGMSGMVFSGNDALQAGLVDVVADESSMNSVVSEWVAKFVSASGDAQKRFKRLHRHFVFNGFKQSKITAEYIADARSSEDGKAGISSFLNKNKPDFIRQLSEKLQLF